MADKLNSNQSMLKSIRKAAQQDMPIYGECGGLMYLQSQLQVTKTQKGTSEW
jgi:cobyrinic acid a,c-diamide synthase